MPPTDGPHTGNQAYPIRKKNEDENACKKPERSPHQVRADDAFQKCIKSLDQPFPEILCSFRHRFHAPRSNLSKHDEAKCNNPSGHHGISGNGWSRDFIHFWKASSARTWWG